MHELKFVGAREEMSSSRLAEARTDLRTYLSEHPFFIGQADDPIDELEDAGEDIADDPPARSQV